MSVNDLLSAFALVLALVAGGGFGLQRQRVAALRGDVTDLTERVNIRDTKISDLERKDAEKDAKIGQLEIELRHAEQMATRNTEWINLDQHLTEHHNEAMRQLGLIKAAIEGRGA